MKKGTIFTILALSIAGCSLSHQSNVRPATTAHTGDLDSSKSTTVRDVRVQFEVVSAGGSKDMRLASAHGLNEKIGHQSVLTDGSIVTSNQLALMDDRYKARHDGGALFGKSALVARITGVRTSPVVKFLSNCKSIDFETLDDSFFKNGVRCGGDLFTYDWDGNGLKIKRNSRTVYKAALSPGVYRLEGSVRRVD